MNSIGRIARLVATASVGEKIYVMIAMILLIIVRFVDQHTLGSVESHHVPNKVRAIPLFIHKTDRMIESRRQKPDRLSHYCTDQTLAFFVNSSFHCSQSGLTDASPALVPPIQS
jgi:hypothetical protein